jgi:hypothetical protein
MSNQLFKSKFLVAFNFKAFTLDECEVPCLYNNVLFSGLLIPYTAFVKKKHLPVANKWVVEFTLVRVRAIRDFLMSSPS